ncbi:MAG TPA: hypothetical protein V7791_00135 [Candidatus Azoamicus sp. OHIO1]
MLRFFYFIFYFIKYRRFLKKYLTSSLYSSNVLIDVSPYYLRKIGIKVLILDFDGVLSSYGETYVLINDVLFWLKFSLEIYTFENIFIFSNNMTKSRNLLLNKIGINMVINRAKKKPYPDAIISILYYKNLLYHEIIMVDDRIFTGILAAELANIRGLFIISPYYNLKDNFLKEFFYIILRKIERFVLFI